MKVDDILGRVRGLDGIAEVNEMQRAMAGDCSGRVMLTAPTGSGKTLAFVVRLLREVEPGGGGGAYAGACGADRGNSARCFERWWGAVRSAGGDVVWGA